MGLAGYLRATLRVQAWRDAVLVMAAAGRRAAEPGAEEFGMFDGAAGQPGAAAGADGVPAAGPPALAPAPPRPAGAGVRIRGAPGYGEVLLGPRAAGSGLGPDGQAGTDPRAARR